MRYSKASAKGMHSVPGGDVWFISLGDLLTLLVCFFLLLTPQAASKVEAGQMKQSVSAYSGTPPDFGTELASLNLDRSSSATEVLPIWSDVVGPIVSPRGQDTPYGPWRLAVKRGLERGDSGVVKLCEREFEQYIVDQIMAELSGFAGLADRLQFEVESDCSSLKKRLGSERHMTAAVIFSGK